MGEWFEGRGRRKEGEVMGIGDKEVGIESVEFDGEWIMRWLGKEMVKNLIERYGKKGDEVKA